jgi:hypothetical protein
VELLIEFLRFFYMASAPQQVAKRAPRLTYICRFVVGRWRAAMLPMAAVLLVLLALPLLAPDPTQIASPHVGL